jgi:hypothetical protein
VAWLSVNAPANESSVFMSERQNQNLAIQCQKLKAKRTKGDFMYHLRHRLCLNSLRYKAERTYLESKYNELIERREREERRKKVHVQASVKNEVAEDIRNNDHKKEGQIERDRRNGAVR